MAAPGGGGTDQAVASVRAPVGLRPPCARPQPSRGRIRGARGPQTTPSGHSLRSGSALAAGMAGVALRSGSGGGRYGVSFGNVLSRVQRRYDLGLFGQRANDPDRDQHSGAADDDDDDTPDLRDRLKRDAKGRKYLDSFLLSQPDQDHLNDLYNHFHLGSPDEWSKDDDKISIREVWSSPIMFRRASTDNPLCDDAKAWAREARRRV